MSAREGIDSSLPVTTEPADGWLATCVQGEEAAAAAAAIDEGEVIIWHPMRGGVGVKGWGRQQQQQQEQDQEQDQEQEQEQQADEVVFGIKCAGAAGF